MKIAIDFHQCTNYYPEIFRHLTRWLLSSGHEVIILSATHPSGKKWIEKDLSFWGVNYSEIVLPPESDFDNEVFLPLHKAAPWKEVVMNKLNIDMLFDDNINLFANENTVIVT